MSCHSSFCVITSSGLSADTLFLDDRSEGKVELPRKLMQDSTNGQIRTRLLTYPVARGPTNTINIVSKLFLNFTVSLKSPQAD